MIDIIGFGGQGSEAQGFDAALMANQQAQEVLELASQVAGRDIIKAAELSTAERIDAGLEQYISISYQQAMIAKLWAEGTLPPAEHTNAAGASAKSLIAGFSLGELSAYAYAGVIGAPYSQMGRLSGRRAEEIFEIALLRNQISKDCLKELHAREGQTGMLAVLGLEAEAIASLIVPIAQIWLVNYNTQKQSVLAGTLKSLAAAEAVLKAHGARRVVKLAVAGAYHSPLMQEAADSFAEALKGYEFGCVPANLMSCLSGQALAAEPRYAASPATALAELFVRPVRWTAMMQELRMLRAV